MKEFLKFFVGSVEVEDFEEVVVGEVLCFFYYGRDVSNFWYYRVYENVGF